MYKGKINQLKECNDFLIKNLSRRLKVARNPDRKSWNKSTLWGFPFNTSLHFCPGPNELFNQTEILS